MALSTDLVSYWKLDESSGNAADSVGSNTLTNVNTTTYAAAKINNGANFASGQSQQLRKNSASIMGTTSSYTMQVWIKFTDVGTRGRGIFTLDESGWFGIISTLHNDTSGKINFLYYNGSFFYQKVSTNNLKDGNWHHIVGVRDRTNGTIELYVDGVSNGTTSAPNDPVIYNNVPYCQLGQMGGDYYIGMIDEAALWSRALSSTEVTELYNSGDGLQYPFSSGATFIPKSNLLTLGCG